MTTIEIPSNVEVAIVGAGPAGLAAACTLLNKGINAIVFDAATEPCASSRATVVHSKTLEILEELGITDQILQKGETVTKVEIRDRESFLAQMDFSLLDCKYPLVMTLPQTETERMLYAKLTELGGTVYRGAKVTDVVDSGDKVQLEVSTLDTKTTVTASYVIAADGLKSGIRESLDIPFKGGEYSASFVTADCRLSKYPLSGGAVQMWLSAGTLLLFIPQPNGVWRIVGTLDNAPKDVVDVALWQRLVNERAVPGIELSEVIWASRFHIHHRLAEHYRKGRVFLAGDAAHVHSPAGGQGMNVGIQDGVRLAEILCEAVKDDKKSDVALDRYEMERRPVAKGVVSLTHSMTMMATVRSPVLVLLRNWFIWAVMSVPLLSSWITYEVAEIEH